MMWALLLLACGGEPQVPESPEPQEPVLLTQTAPKASRVDPTKARTATANEGAAEALERASAPGEPVITVPVEPDLPGVRSPANSRGGPPKQLRDAIATSPHHAAGE